MGKELMILDIFREAVSKCSLALEQFGINVIRLIMEGTEKDFKDNPLNSLICITAVQVCLSVHKILTTMTILTLNCYRLHSLIYSDFWVLKKTELLGIQLEK